MRIDELASAVGASVASANRFARALGFDGYPQFREALVRGFEATLAPVERLRSAQESLTAGDDLVDASLEQAANNLHATRTAIDRAAADAAVEAIIAARRVFVIGYGASAFLAGLMEHGVTEAWAQGLLDMATEIEQGIYHAESRTPQSTTPTSFRQWCEEVLKPAVDGGPDDQS